jgi:tetratricopeptide (TPR) repeat protein
MRVLPVMALRPGQLDRDHPLRQALDGLEAEQQLRRVHLRPLDSQELGVLVAEQLGTGNVPSALSEFVVARSGGLPGFAVETLRWLEAESYISRRGAGIDTDTAALRELERAAERGELPVPEPIADSVKCRLAELNTASLGVLQIGALLGNAFTAPVVAEASGLGMEDARSTLDDLESSGVLQRLEATVPSYSFRHPAVRDVVLSGLLGGERAELVTRVAHALEQQVAEHRVSKAVSLARLYGLAGDPHKTLEYLPLAAAEHQRKGDLERAVASHILCLETIEGLAPRERLSVTDVELQSRRSLAALLLQLGRLPKSAQQYRELATRAHAEGKAQMGIDATIGLAEVTRLRGDHHQAEQFARSALEAARNFPYQAGTAEASEILGILARRDNRIRDAAGHFQAALELRRGAGDHQAQARLLAQLGLLFRLGHNLEKASKHLSDALETSRRHHDPAGEALVLSLQSSVHLLLNEYDHAYDTLGRALSMERDLGRRRGEALCLQGIGYLRLSEGSYTLALDHFERAYSQLIEIGDDHHAAFSLINLGHTRFRTGEYPQALEHYTGALALIEKTGCRTAGSEAASGLALTLLQLDEPIEAVSEARRAVALARECEARQKEAWALLTCAKVESAYEDAERALELAERVGDTNLLYMVHHQLAVLARKNGRTELARTHFQKAFTVIDSIAERAGSARDAFLSKPPVTAVFKDAAKL